MGIELQKGENVLYPAPYVPSEPALLVVTTSRTVYFGSDGRQEMLSRDLIYTGRSVGRPYWVIALFLALLGLPLSGYAAYSYLSVYGKPSFAEQPPAVTEGVELEDPADARWRALYFGAPAVLLMAGAYFLIKKKRYLVICRNRSGDLMKIAVEDSIKQMTLMMTIQATAMASGGQSAPPPNAPPKK